MSTKPLLYDYPIDLEEEKKVILREYKALLRALKDRIKKGDRRTLRTAFEMAVDAHKEMRRKSGEPYILHPLAVARITVEEIGLGVTSACCALLHDTVEDTEITLEDIEMEFGTPYAKIIDGLTKMSHVVDMNANTSMQAENFRKILLTLAEDPRVILIKIADRLHNMRTLGSMARHKQLKIASETSFIYAPLAHRLGLYEIKTELEDLSLKYTRPDIYLDIVRKLNETKRDRNKYIKDFIKPIVKELEDNDLKFDIYGRPKSIYSIYNKMRSKGVTFDEVYDLFAIRIIIDTPPEIEKASCWKAYSLVTNSYQPNPDRLRDWISLPKSNGYEALHTTVMGPGGRWVEVQIRSKKMDEIAEKGLAAHWKYKEGSQTESKLDAWLKHIGEVLNNPDIETVDFVEDFKLDLFTKEIYVYTPKGEMRVLPLGATALDFAFDIHTELGARCIGAKVNYKLVPISHILKSGDQIEIIASSKQKPNEDWLNFVFTGKAKSGIKYFLKEEKRKIAQEGKEVLFRKLKSQDINTDNKEHLQEIAQYFKLSSPLDLFHAVATHKIDIRILKNLEVVGGKYIFPKEERNVVNQTENNQIIDLQSGKVAKDAELIIFGESSDKIQYKLAPCCQPIPGDDVFGYVSTSEGLKIHRTDCPNAAQLMANFAHRIVKTKWAANKEISFLTGIKLIGMDDVGIIQGMTNIITSKMKLNMRSISLDSKDGIFEGTIMVFVKDIKELDKLCNKLAALPGIHKVERIEGV
ncbi:MAG TPA: bifunctional (p)ppGpp synthetase/guanosine-3',5'-bis(diphosphate) 3'-pyrophosphohydrolase [Chitinophagaceae bacterium]|nr:bifunctional (p)ppGpp synthetase/guanosine-3',5'-bis(diphosphate) 3'-pyrophosphohydrolase [Chitinophagaceae bacterium]